MLHRYAGEILVLFRRVDAMKTNTYLLVSIRQDREGVAIGYFDDFSGNYSLLTTEKQGDRKKQKCEFVHQILFGIICKDTQKKVEEPPVFFKLKPRNANVTKTSVQEDNTC